MDTKNYMIKIDGEGKVLNEDFDATINDLFASHCDFILSIVDENDISEERINKAVNCYVRDCQKPRNERGIGLGFDDSFDFSPCLREFIEHIICYSDPLYIQNIINHDDEKHVFDCFSYINRNEYFKFALPNSIIDSEKLTEFRFLGPDYLVGTLLPEDIFNYVLPHFYLFLYDCNGFDDDEINKLNNYSIGLH